MMLTQLECFPCFLRQTIIALGQTPQIQDARIRREILNDVLAIMLKADTGKPPAHTTTFIHRTIRDRLGLDPFKERKREYNTLALGLYHTLKSKVKGSKDPLWTAARLAIAGNVIDFGIFTSIDIDGSIRRALGPSIAVDDYPAFRETVREAEDILYLLDNAGEIVFDGLLIEQLVSSGKRVCAAVKGSPVLNDVTHEDALQTGLTKLCRVIDNGSDAVGTMLGWTSPEFQSAFHAADLVISKGQGNFETLAGNGKKTFFLFQSKCEVVSNELGLPLGSMLLKKS
jgi:damage-control phosphatase, subfamily I